MAFETDPLADALAIVLAVLPIAFGLVLLFAFDQGPIQIVGMVMVGAGTLVGALLVLLRWGMG